MDLNPLKQSMLLSQASLKLQVEIKKQNLHLRQLEAKLQAREKCAKESSSQVQSQQTFQQKIPAGKMMIKAKGLVMRVKNTGAIEAELKQTVHRVDDRHRADERDRMDERERSDERDRYSPKPRDVPIYGQQNHPPLRYHADDPVYDEPPRRSPYQPEPRQRVQPEPRARPVPPRQYVHPPAQRPVYAQPAYAEPEYYNDYEQYEQEYEAEYEPRRPVARHPPQQGQQERRPVQQERRPVQQERRPVQQERRPAPKRRPIQHSIVDAPQRKRTTQRSPVREYEEFEEEEYMEEEVEPIKSYRQPAPRPAAPKPAAPRQPAPSSAPSSGFRIIVSNLHPAVTLGDVEELFTAIGPVKSLGMLLPGVAELVYKVGSHAEQAIDKYHNRDLDGQPMQVIYETRQQDTRQQETRQQEPELRKAKKTPHYVNPSRQPAQQPKQQPKQQQQRHQLKQVQPKQRQQQSPLVRKDRRFVPKAKPVQANNKPDPARRGQRKPSANHSFTITM